MWTNSNLVDIFRKLVSHLQLLRDGHVVLSRCFHKITSASYSDAALDLARRLLTWDGDSTSIQYKALDALCFCHSALDVASDIWDEIELRISRMQTTRAVLAELDQEMAGAIAEEEHEKDQNAKRPTKYSPCYGCKQAHAKLEPETAELLQGITAMDIDAVDEEAESSGSEDKIMQDAELPPRVLRRKHAIGCSLTHQDIGIKCDRCQTDGTTVCRILCGDCNARFAGGIPVPDTCILCKFRKTGEVEEDDVDEAGDSEDDIEFSDRSTDDESSGGFSGGLSGGFTEGLTGNFTEGLTGGFTEGLTGGLPRQSQTYLPELDFDFTDNASVSVFCKEKLTPLITTHNRKRNAEKKAEAFTHLENVYYTLISAYDRTNLPKIKEAADEVHKQVQQKTSKFIPEQRKSPKAKASDVANEATDVNMTDDHQTHGSAKGVESHAQPPSAVVPVAIPSQGDKGPLPPSTHTHGPFTAGQPATQPLPFFYVPNQQFLLPSKTITSCSTTTTTQRTSLKMKKKKQKKPSMPRIGPS